MDERFSKRIKDTIESTNPFIAPVLIKFPRDLIGDFDAFCKREAGDCYWLGIKMLLKFWNESAAEDIKIRYLLERIDKLDGRVFELENIGIPQVSGMKESRKTFGQKKEVGNEV